MAGKRTPRARACPCGSPAYAQCCGPLHDGKPAENPQALMRSRFSAFALDLSDYVLATWHPDTRPETLESDPGLRWVRLEVLESTGGTLFDAEGTVTFRAHFRDDGTPGVLDEKSRFVRHHARWVYHGPM
ncbi:YchJ family protein [Actinoplanes sp. L3-i22]|uniref:YchJ family protein n=1 Tax=Actinoplanes sp. L3-i22 TaxID=2836373 RepID=UPI001C84A686|nr:YchJ family metal-binding protein [Actinoplanes sp. L3-i22]